MRSLQISDTVEYTRAQRALILMDERFQRISLKIPRRLTGDLLARVYVFLIFFFPPFSSPAENEFGRSTRTFVPSVPGGRRETRRVRTLLFLKTIPDSRRRTSPSALSEEYLIYSVTAPASRKSRRIRRTFFSQAASK